MVVRLSDIRNGGGTGTSSQGIVRLSDIRSNERKKTIDAGLPVLKQYGLDAAGMNDALSRSTAPQGAPVQRPATLMPKLPAAPAAPKPQTDVEKYLDEVKQGRADQGVPGWLNNALGKADQFLYDSKLGRQITGFSQGAADALTGVEAASGTPQVGGKAARTVGALASVAVNPAAPETSLIQGGYRAAEGVLGTRAGQGVVRGTAKALEKTGVRAGTANNVAQNLVRGGIAGATQNVAQMAAAGQTSPRQLAENAAVGGVLGGAGDALVGVASRFFSRLRAEPTAPNNDVLALPAPRVRGNASAVETPDVVYGGGKVEPAALPAPEMAAPTTGRVQRVSNPYRQKYEQLISVARQLQGDNYLPPGREYEYLNELWSHMAGREDPGLDELIRLAYDTPARKPVTPDLIGRARETQRKRDVYGVPLPAKTVQERLVNDYGATSPAVLETRVGRNPESIRPTPKTRNADPSLPGVEPSTAARPAANIDSIVQEIKAADEALAELDRRYAQQGKYDVADVERRLELEGQKRRAAERLVSSLPEDVQAMRTGAAASREPSVPVQAEGQLPDVTREPAYQRMNAEPIPFRPANPDANAKPIALREIRKSVEKMFKLPVRTGRLGTADEDVLGVYKRTPEVVRTRNQGGLQEISHELGHHFDKKYKLQDARYEKELRNLIDEVSGIDTAAYTPQELLAEGPAEFMRLYLTDPATAKRLAPGYYAHFESSLPASDLKKLAKVQDMAARWIDQGEAMQFRGKITEARKESGGSIKERALKAYEATVDKYTRLAVAEKEITGSKELADAEESLYKRARLTAGAPKKAQAIVNEMIKVFKPLEKEKIPLRDFRDFATALHARDLEDLGYETGWTRSQIDKTIQQYDSPLFRKVQAELVAFQDRLIDMAVEGQLLTRAAADAMKKKYPNYVPMFREFDDEAASGLITGRGFADLNSPIKKLKGSSRDVKDPIENIVRNVYSIVDSVEKNKVGLELARLSKKDGAGYWIEKLDGKQSVRNENIVTVWENGEKAQYQLEPDLYRTIKTLDEDTSNMVVKLLSVPAQLLRSGATLAPEFILRNPMRDQFPAFVASEFGYNPIIDLPKGLFRVIKGKYWKNGDKVYNQWVHEGGGYGNIQSMNRNYLREQVNQLKDEGNKWARRTVGIVNPKQWLRVLQSISELTEEATKVGEFGRGIRKGATPAEAAYQSRDLMDFARVGNSIKQINRVNAFFNANIQGKDKIARAFIKHPARSTIRAITSVTLPTIGIYFWNERHSNEKQKETLREAPQWLRDTFYLISMPHTDVVLRVPKPFDLAPVFSNLAENILRWTRDNDPQAWGEFAKSQAVQLGNLPYMLTALTPVIENIANYDFFTKGPVVPRRDQGSTPAEQYGNNTSSVAKELGGLLNYSPYKIDNLISGYAASLGKHATAGIDAILDKTGISTRPPAAAKTFSELPIINSFTVDNSGGGKSLDDFYKELNKITEKYNSYQDHGKGTSAVVPEYKAISKVSRDISKLNAERRDVQASRDMTPKQKRDYLDELDQHIRSLARQGLDISKR